MTRDTRFCLSAEGLGAACVARGAEKARPEDVAGVHELALRLFGQRIAPASILTAIREWNEDTLFVHCANPADDDADETGASRCVYGFLALLPLTDRGVEALWTGSFDALRVQTAWVSARTDEAHGIYVWGVGAQGVRSRSAIWGLARDLEDQVFCHLPHFASPATDRGESLMRQRGYSRLTDHRPGANQSVWIRPARSAAPHGPSFTAER